MMGETDTADSESALSPSQTTLNCSESRGWLSPFKSGAALIDTSSESHGTGGSTGSFPYEAMTPSNLNEKEHTQSSSAILIPSDDNMSPPVISILSPPNRTRRPETRRRVHFAADVIEASSSSDSSSIESDSQESPLSSSSLFDPTTIPRELLEQHVQEMALKLVQLQSDLSLERTLSKRKQRGFIRMAKEMAKKVVAMEQMESYIAEVNQVLQETREAYATAENDRQRLLELLLLKQQQLTTALLSTVPRAEKDPSIVARPRYLSFESERSNVNDISRDQDHYHNQCIVTIITLSFGLCAVLLILLHPELFSRSWWCGPAMPGSFLKPQTVYEAPWWMPISSYKSRAFQNFCLDKNAASEDQFHRTSLEWQNQNLHLTRNTESKTACTNAIKTLPEYSRMIPSQGLFGYHYELMSSESRARKTKTECTTSETTHSAHTCQVAIDSIHIPFKSSQIDIALSETEEPTVKTHEHIKAPWDS